MASGTHPPFSWADCRADSRLVCLRTHARVFGRESAGGARAGGPIRCARVGALAADVRDLEMAVSRSARHLMELASAEPLALFADGGYVQETPVTIGIVPRALHVIAP